MAAIKGTSTKSITRFQLEVAELVRKMQKMTEEGKSAGEQMKELGGKFTELKKRGTQLEKFMRIYAKNTKDGAKATANLKTRLTALNTEVNKVTTAEKKLNTQIKKDTEQKKKNAQATDKAAKSKKGFAAGVQSALGTLARFAAAGALVAAATKALNFIFVESFKRAVEFEKALGNLAAVGGATQKEIEQLGKAALDAAGSTKFTANQIVELQTELSKLGFTADEVVDSTLAISIGAQALGAGLGETAQQVGKLINQFGLLAQDAEMVVDTLVTTINESALSMQTFGVAVQYVGPIARDLGIDLQATAGAMAVLADNGFTASRIGTGLRSILTELGSETVDVESKLKDLAKENISLAEAVDLVGKRNAAQLITLLNSVEVLDETESKYYEQGRAMQSAANQATTFSGQMELVSSAINEVQIGFGDFILETGILKRALFALSDSAKETYLGFELLKEIGAGEFSKDLELLDSGMSAFEVTLQRVSKETGKSVEQIRNALTQETMTGAFNFFGIGDLLTGDVADKFEGYFELLTAEQEKLKDRNIIAKEREAVDDLYKLTLTELIQKEREGVDVSGQANSLASDINKTRQGLIKSSKKLQEDIETDTSLTEEQIESKKDLILAYNAQEKALAAYERRFANFILSDDLDDDKVEKRKAENFQEIIDKNYELKKSIEDRFDIEKATNEANKEFTKNSLAEIEAKGKLFIANDNTIAQLEEEREKRIKLKATKDKNTKQGEYDIRILDKEIDTLDKLIRKYEKQNDTLGINADTMKNVTANTEKALQALQKSYSEGDITGVQFKRQAAALIDKMGDDLYLAAGDNEELQKLVQAIVDNFDNPTDIDWNAILFKGIEEAISTTVDALGQFNDVALENTKARLEAEKEALKSRYETEDYLAKQQFENGLINETQYRRRQMQLRKKQVAEENAIDKQIFEAQKKKDRNDAKVDFLEAVASIIPTLIKEGIAEPTTLSIMAAITAASAAASYAAEVSAIGQRKFYPKKFAEGGMVDGPSHAQGGVPFTVQGQSGYEMEGGEFIVNKRAASLHRDLLEKINNSAKVNTAPQPMMFANGGVVNKTKTIIAKESSESVDYLKVIAQATATAAMNSDKPVRAFVTSSDLRTDATARRIKDNNTTI